MEATINSVFLAALITALVTGLGAVPFLFVRNISAWWLSVANGAAAGLMLGASHNLIAEGTKLDPGRMLLGILAGLIAIVAANWLIRQRRTVEIAELRGASARRALLLLGVMTVHSFAEGVGVRGYGRAWGLHHHGHRHQQHSRRPCHLPGADP